VFRVRDSTDLIYQLFSFWSSHYAFKCAESSGHTFMDLKNFHFFTRIKFYIGTFLPTPFPLPFL
jgi:hypothetical protein